MNYTAFGMCHVSYMSLEDERRRLEMDSDDSESLGQVFRIAAFVYSAGLPALYQYIDRCRIIFQQWSTFHSVIIIPTNQQTCDF